MPNKLPISCLMPLAGLETLNKTVKDFKIPGQRVVTPLDPTVSAILHTLRTIQTQLEPLPDHARETTYGFVAAQCTGALTYACALDGEIEYVPITTTTGRPFKICGWIVGVTAGLVLEDPSHSYEADDNQAWRAGSYLDVVPQVPILSSDLPAKKGFLLPIPGTQLFDPRPRMN